jgi:hypothetical protein
MSIHLCVGYIPSTALTITITASVSRRGVIASASFAVAVLLVWVRLAIAASRTVATSVLLHGRVSGLKLQGLGD